MAEEFITKGFSHSCKVLTYEGLKYIDDLKDDDMLYTYDIKGGYSEYTKLKSIELLKDNFLNLTDLKLSTTNSILTSPTNPMLITTKGGLLLTHSSSLVKGVSLLVCIADDIKELNLNIDMFIEGVITSALDVKLDYNVNVLCSNTQLLCESLKSKRIRYSITDKGYIRLLEPITLIDRGLPEGIYSKGIRVRLSYLLGILECLTQGYTEDKSALILKHTDSNFIQELCCLMLTVGVLPLNITKEKKYTVLEYTVPVNIRKLYNSKVYEDIEDSYDIVSESRIVKREGEGTRGIRLYFRRLEHNPLKLSYEYYGNIVELVINKSKYCLVSTMGVPIML